MIRANDNLATLNEKLIDTLPTLAESTRSHGKQLVKPIGNTCREIRQYSKTQEIVIDEAEAAVIRGSSQMEVAEMQTFKCRRITEVNVKTGHCILDIEGFDKPVSGKISDPAINTPNNVYTNALNESTGFSVVAKPVRMDGVVSKLFISDAKKR